MGTNGQNCQQSPQEKLEFVYSPQVLLIVVSLFFNVKPFCFLGEEKSQYYQYYCGKLSNKVMFDTFTENTLNS